MSLDEQPKAPYVPDLDYTLDINRVKPLLEQLPEDSPLRKYIQEQIIDEYSQNPEQWSFNQELENFRNMGECHYFLETDEPETEDDEQYVQWYYDWLDDLWRLIYRDATEADKTSTLYRQLQIFLEVFIHSPWNRAGYPINNGSYPNYSFKDAWLIYYLITHSWSHENHEVRNIEQL